MKQRRYTRKFYLSISYIIIAILLFLVVCAVTLFVLRICIPSCLNSMLRSVKEFFENWEIYGIHFLSWIPKVYRCLKDLVHTSNGGIEPLAYLVGLTGLVNFALVAVDALLTKRTYGILLFRVINFFFPNYHIIQFGFHFFLYILGGFSCKIGYGQVAALCALGLAVCFIHAVTMYVMLHLSKDKLQKLVIRYMHRIDCGGASKEYRADVHDFSDYVNQEWRSGSIAQADSNQEIDLGGELLYCLKRILEDLHVLPSAACGRSISEAFFSYFAEQTYSGDNQAEYIMYTQVAPCLSVFPTSLTHIQCCTQECQLLWERLLRGEEFGLWQSRLVDRVLSSALSDNEQSLIWPLTLGLLRYLELSCPHGGDILDEKSLQQQMAVRMDFLFQILKESASNSLIDNKDSEEINEVLGQLEYLAIGVIQWANELGHIPDNIGNWAAKNVSEMLERMVCEERIIEGLIYNREAYMVISFVLFLIENPDISNKLSVYSILQAWTSIRTKMGISKYA